MVAGEAVLARIALVAIAVHVLDDSFVQPEPGTSAGDHLVSGLVPLFVLGVAAWGYPRPRPGARATTALMLGLFGIVAGAVEGGYHLVTGGLSGDDYTGLLAFVGGLLLVAVGVVVLWRSRRSDDTRRRRYVRRSGVGAAAALVAFEVAMPVLFAYGYTHVGRSSVPEAHLGGSYEDVTFVTGDGLRLAGWYVPSKNGATIIVLPARGRSGPQEHVRMLVRHGYGVLIFDPRGTGQSQGDPYRWGGEKDVKAALAFLRGRRDVDPERIGGLGLSLGGELMLQTAAEATALEAVVSEGAGVRSIREHMNKPGARKWLSVPTWVTLTAAIAVFSNHAPPPDLNGLVARISPRPVFLIYSGHPVGGEELNATFYASAGQPRTLWRIADAGHTDGLERHPAEYERRVIAFFDNALLPAR
ncbi:MAG TPA: alpha/beta fold hydrolase [Kribbellaceae bacterium]|nr:alpha/beta fold hydrolase [Kribbellaceae bacterium]